MGSPTTVPGDLVVPGSLRLTGDLTPTKARSEILSMVELQPFVIPWTWWRTWDAVGTNLPNAAADDDLGLVGGTWTTGVPSIQTLDFGGTTTTAYARAFIPLPWEYVAAQTVVLRFHAGALTTLPDTTLTLDVVAYKSGEKSLVSAADICGTTMKDIRSLTMADVDFTITPTTLSPGDALDVRIVMIGTDAGHLGAMVGCIGSVKLLCDVR